MDRSLYPVAGCPATSIPRPRNCWIKRQTSDRLDEISCAILVPLTTTMACSISNRTIRPKRTSVWCSGLADFFAGLVETAPVRGPLPLRIGVFLAMEKLCANYPETTIDARQEARACSYQRHGLSASAGRQR